jgi:peptidoglycan hydrolase-like protein with peptidoglycan-binding domain
MKNLIRQIIEEENRRILNESGIRDIKALAKRYPMAKIYFHQDLDGVTTALAMKNYLEQHGIKVVDAEIIQYGSKEFAIKKVEGEGEIMPVLVDFAHGKPMFVIHTDHHDSQAGVEQGTSTNFKSSRSNVETISQSVSPKDIFTQDDIETISMIDSADYAKYDITPEQVIQYLFKLDRTKGVKENKKMMGLVANKLLLAFKNKPDFLRNLVMNSKPSLQSILLNIKDQMEKEGYAPVEQLMKNQETYIQSRKDKGVTYEDGIISQYGLGSMKPGGYDRYTPFINHPNAEFLVTGLPMGMVQASCNPYKKERALKGVDLGQIKDEILDKFKDELESQRVTFGTLKRISEMDTSEKSVGFTYKDMLAIYGNAPSFTVRGGKDLERQLQQMSQSLYKDIPYEDKKLFNRVYVNGYDVIQANSGGHKCITNISGINFLYPKSKFDDPAKRRRVSYIDLLKAIQQEFVDTLKQKIEDQKQPVSENYLRVKKKLILSENLSRLNQLLTEAEKRAWSKGVFDNGDGVTTPKITVNKGNNFFDITYEGPETGFNIESAVINPNDSIHQLSNVFTYEVNKHLKDLYQKGVYVKPNMESIEMVKKPKFFEIKISFNETDKENAITRIDRRGGMGHPATKGKSLMQEKCSKYSGCEKVYTVKAGSITEHFVSYKPTEKQEGEVDSDLVSNLEKIYDQKETFEKQEKPYPVERGVELLQTALQFLGFSLPEWGVDGRFGPETEKAVTDFQEKNSLDVTGIADQETIAKLIEKMDENDFENQDMSKIQKSKSKSIDDDTTIPENIVIGDSQTPYVANGSADFELISSKGSEDSLWLGGKTLSWLLSAVKKHKGSSKVKNIAIVIGTNGNFNTNDDISGLITELESKFPNANLYVVQGSWGWGGLKNTTEQKVRKYYQEFKDLGVTVIEPPIGNIEPHGNKPVYKKIGANLDSLV